MALLVDDGRYGGVIEHLGLLVVDLLEAEGAPGLRRPFGHDLCAT